jgi:hypothetical protein
MVVILRTPAKTPLHPRDITAALRASFIYFQVIAGPRSDIHRAGSQHDYDSYIYNAHNMRDRLNKKPLKYYPQWELQRNVLGWTRAGDYGRISVRHREAHEAIS